MCPSVPVCPVCPVCVPAPPGVFLPVLYFEFALVRPRGPERFVPCVSRLPGVFLPAPRCSASTCVDQVMAVLEVEEVFSLDDLRRLAGHPHFDSCGLSVLSVLKIRDALASQQSQQPQQPQQTQQTQPPHPPQPPQPTQLQQPQQSPQLPQSPPFAVAETRDALPSQQPRHETQAEMQAAAEDFAIDLLKLSPQARVLRFCNRLRADPETAMKEHLKELRSAAIAQAQAASQPHADAIETVRADQALRDAGKYYRLAIAHEIVPTPISESSRSAM